MRIGNHEVVVDGAGEQDSFLWHHTEVVAQLVCRQIADVVAVELDLSVGWLIEALQQLDTCAKTNA